MCIDKARGGGGRVFSCWKMNRILRKMSFDIKPAQRYCIFISRNLRGKRWLFFLHAVRYFFFSVLCGVASGVWYFGAQEYGIGNFTRRRFNSHQMLIPPNNKVEVLRPNTKSYHANFKYNTIAAFAGMVSGGKRHCTKPPACEAAEVTEPASVLAAIASSCRAHGHGHAWRPPN